MTVYFRWCKKIWLCISDDVKKYDCISKVVNNMTVYIRICKQYDCVFQMMQTIWLCISKVVNNIIVYFRWVRVILTQSMPTSKLFMWPRTLTRKNLQVESQTLSATTMCVDSCTSFHSHDLVKSEGVLKSNTREDSSSPVSSTHVLLWKEN